MEKYINPIQKSLSKEFPELSEHCPLLTERLITLLYERLSEATCQSLSASDDTDRIHGDRTVGYPLLVEKAFYSVPWDISENFANRVVDRVLGLFYQHLSEDQRKLILAELPMELLIRMDIPVEQLKNRYSRTTPDTSKAM